MPTQEYIPSLTLAIVAKSNGGVSELELCARLRDSSIDAVELLQVQDCIKKLVTHQLLVQVSPPGETTKRYAVTPQGQQAFDKETERASIAF
jgi:hypothetical protein